MGNLLIGIGMVIHYLLTFYMYVVIFSAVITWVNPDPYNPIVRFLRGMTEPLYYYIRRYIRTNIGMIDIAPLIVLAVIMVADYGLAQNVIDYGYRMKGGGILFQ